MRENAQSDALDAFRHAIIIVDRAGRLIFANRKAQTMLAAGTGVRASSHGLTCPTAAATSRLRAMISMATSEEAHLRVGGAMLVDRAAPDGPLQVLVSSLGSQRGVASIRHSGRVAMLSILEPTPTPGGVEGVLIALYGLTPAEARVACDVGSGRNPNEVADVLGLTPATVRTHLHRVFAKTDTRRQAELVRLLAQIALAATANS